MKLLLHTCCAPCAIEPLREAKKDNFTVTGFFYNPNVHPYSEYVRRKKESEKLFESERLKLISPEYDVTYFFRNIAGNERTPGRCLACWEARLAGTLSFANENKFDAFTTTLLGSPYQDHGVLKNICENLSKKNKIDFYYKDFRTGFREAHNLAKAKGIYCQNYCGCVFSMVEREEAKGIRHELRR